jgi:mRNA interferase RelE/StbE
MAWEVRLSDRARKDLKKLDRQVATRVLRFFYERIKGENDPRSIGTALEGSELGEFWRYRIGDWRAVCRIEDETVTVLVLTVEHRSQVYK